MDDPPIHQQQPSTTINPSQKRKLSTSSSSSYADSESQPTTNLPKNAFDTLMGIQSSKPSNPSARKAAKYAKTSSKTSPGRPSLSHKTSSSSAIQTADDAPHHPTSKPPTSRSPQLFRNALSPFIINPSKYPPSIIITSSPSFTLIRDKYPKSLLHLLLLPRDLKKSVQHPFEAFKDRAFLENVYQQADAARILVAKELKRKFGGGSWEDWVSEVKVGVHANPSMNNLHIHIISRDMCGVAMKKAGHYNTFNTPFFVQLETFKEKDWGLLIASHKEYGEMLNGSLKCWRCGQDFGRKLVQLKAHLEVELEKWKEDVRARSTTKGEKDQLVLLPSSMQESKPPQITPKSPPLPPPKSTPPMAVIDEHDDETE